ncbi:sugar transferase [Arsenicicoccus dermatophilus]|uniref:sugar transferase n=1 Tax=Arsenicicoccus dermatophilus TaxID=1076331 RepID=UPI001F4D2F98|nr:sugar transferase [Arsenicicoccus dermatophilus]MCH8613583.1 sugar transferase [Arsenicicoccus dermatophilus]
MTVQQELRDGAEPQGEERRQPTTRPRISWTSDRPYVVPAAVAGRERTPEEVERFDPVARARTRRARWERPTMGQAVVGDVLIAITLTFVLMVNDQRTLHQSIAGAVGTGILWCVLLLIRRGYDLRRMSEVTAAVQAVAGAAFGAMAVLGFLSYAMKVELPRRYVLVGVPAIAFLTIVHRLMVRHTLKRRRTSGDAMLRTLVAGDGSTAGAFAHELATTKDHGMQVVGMALASLDVVPMTPGSSQVPVWGVLSEIPQMVVDHDIDVVVVTGGGLSGNSLRRLSWALERVGADLVVAPGMVDTTPSLVTMQPTAGLQLLHWERPSDKLGRGILKNIQDRTIALLAIIGVSPILVITAAAIKLTSRGPIFYTQQRLGQDAQPFTMIKFRSMVTDSDALRAQLVKQHQSQTGQGNKVLFKMADDPRITKVGKIIRRYSIDELPQLFNVLRGDMALIGPRPPLAEEAEKYHDKDNRRLRVKPGLTGLWQVSGRSNLDWDQSVNLDLRYVDNWSLGMDMQILLKTARAVLKGDGAY